MRLNMSEPAAEKARKGPGDMVASDLSGGGCSMGAKGSVRGDEALQALRMEEIADVDNLRTAYAEVARNKGAAGPDRQSIQEVGKRLAQILPELAQSLLEGRYQPGDVRRVWIPKAGGGQRGLGIPNVIDRVVQQAILRVVQPHFDPKFDQSSHGFRPGKSCHTAIAEAKRYIEQGYEWVVDMDIEKFFDKVNHQRLQAAIERRISDRRITEVVRRMLKARTVLPDGVIVRNEEGTPQGGPLSPLLSNIVLDELDTELRRRGHKFVRYADDCNIYVRSQKAGQRVLESVSRYLEKRMRLRVNATKSAVAKPGERHFLGFKVGRNPETKMVEIKLSERSKELIAAKIKELTPRSWGKPLRECIDSINVYLQGWMGYFRICGISEEYTFRRLDAHIRRRLRAIILRQRKRKRNICHMLIKLGVNARTAWTTVYQAKKSLWKLSHIRAVEQGLSNKYLSGLKLRSLLQAWQAFRNNAHKA